jgi:hypothetical protein
MDLGDTGSAGAAPGRGPSTQDMASSGNRDHTHSARRVGRGTVHASAALRRELGGRQRLARDATATPEALVRLASRSGDMTDAEIFEVSR